MTSNALKEIDDAIDRVKEAHFHLLQMVDHYHSSNGFRYSLNSFIRAIKEVPQILMMELQQKSGFKAWFKIRLSQLNEDSLMATLAKKRNYVVHMGMLVPTSFAYVGITEGRGLKFGISVPLNPLEDSDAGMDRICRFSAAEKDPFGFFVEDEESAPCVLREWKIEEFGDQNLLDVAYSAWMKSAQLVSDACVWLGGEPFDLHNRQPPATERIKVQVYPRRQLRKIYKIRRKRPNQALQTTSVTRSGFGKVPVSDRQRRGV